MLYRLSIIIIFFYVNFFVKQRRKERNIYVRLELSAALWYNDANNLIRAADLADRMWLATGHMGADLSKTFSKKSLEIVLEAEILAPSTVSGFGKDKTPKALDFTGFSAFSIVFYSRLFCVNVGFQGKS